MSTSTPISSDPLDLGALPQQDNNNALELNLETHNTAPAAAQDGVSVHSPPATAATLPAALRNTIFARILAQLARLEGTVGTLQEDTQDIEYDIGVRTITSPRSTPVKPTIPSDASFTSVHVDEKLRLKASDFPKLSGKDTEDINQWIEKVTAIYGYSGVSNGELLQHLPMVLQGKALTWFTQLGRNKRAVLLTGNDWQDALRNAFYLPRMRVRAIEGQLETREAIVIG